MNGSKKTLPAAVEFFFAQSSYFEPVSTLILGQKPRFPYKSYILEV